jgi:hypothetical protein
VRQIGKLRGDVPPGPADLVVAISGRCEGLRSGWTLLFQRYATVTNGCEASPANQATAQAILSHELAHLFGAFRPDSNVESVMRGGARRQVRRPDSQDAPPDARLRFLGIIRWPAARQTRVAQGVAPDAA